MPMVLTSYVLQDMFERANPLPQDLCKLAQCATVVTCTWVSLQECLSPSEKMLAIDFIMQVYPLFDCPSVQFCVQSASEVCGREIRENEFQCSLWPHNIMVLAYTSTGSRCEHQVTCPACRNVQLSLRSRDSSTFDAVCKFAIIP